MPRTLGVEEEFHLVDLKTRRLTARAPELLNELSDSYVAELQRCVVEMNSGVVETLDGLRADLQGHRRVLVDAATRLGMGVVAAGAVPLSVPAEMQVTQTARYRQMLADYQLLAREQLICGTQVHVGVEDRDESVVVANRVAPYLPTLLALSRQLAVLGGRVRHRLLQRAHPGVAALADDAGSPAPVSLGRRVRQARRRPGCQRGDQPTPGMVYFDVRPVDSPAPTLELRICDSLSVGGHHRADRRAVPGTGRARGRRAAGRRAGIRRSRRRWVGPRLWRAARSGLEGELVDIEWSREPACGRCRHPNSSGRCARSSKPRVTGSIISDLTRKVLIAGTSAGRQRRALRRRGRLTDVVDQLIAETAGSWPSTVAAVMEDPTLLFGYHPDREYDSTDKTAAVSYDEAVDPTGGPRPALRRGPAHRRQTGSCRCCAPGKAAHRAGPARRQHHVPGQSTEPRAGYSRST